MWPDNEDTYYAGSCNIARLLKDGQLVKYDACSERFNDYDFSVFEYIGYGKIYSVNGSYKVAQPCKNLYFFKYRNRGC